MTDFDYNIPLLLPSLTEEEKMNMRIYTDFYEQYRDEISDWAEEELRTHPGWGNIINSMTDEERLEQRKISVYNQHEAVFNDNWEPLLTQLIFFGVFYARIGLSFQSWFELVNMIRRYLTPVLLKQGDPVSTITILNGMDQFMDIVMSNISEAYLYEQKRVIEKQKQEQELLNKELENFVYIASHDLQEPLNTITSFTNLLEEDYGYQFNDDARECLSFIKASSSRMTELITALLEYSKVARNREFQLMPLETIVREVLEDLKGRIVQTNAKVEINGTLPVLPVSQIGMKMLFQNLIGNAIKFHQKGIPPIVRITAEPEGGRWHFVVEDNGIGIADKDKDKVFVIFRRLHQSSEYEGTGIGLAHCKKIVEVHGGEIWLESIPGQGSKFHFTLAENQIINEEA
jgi:signal transduction histidine kinase